jgi:outer membrane biogenesis lipoprotein LolB
MNALEGTMKKPVIILLSINALLLGACASQQPAPAQAQIASTATQMSPSEEYQRYVEKHAKQVHAELHWYHIPDDDDVDKTDS